VRFLALSETYGITGHKRAQTALLERHRELAEQG
jgi:hypothetical protein